MPKLAPLLLVLALTGCVALPTLKHPSPELPAAWPQGAADARVAPDGWTVYGDPVLDRLIDEAMTHNRDLRVAAARIEQARAALGIAQADRQPHAELAADIDRSRHSQAGAMPMPGGAHNSFKVDLRAAYELDLWGRYRAASDAARAELLASEQAREVVRIGLADAVARGYFALIALDARHALARRTLDNRRAAAHLHALRHRGGIAPELALRQAEAEVAAGEVVLTRLDAQRRQQELALAVLLGREPRALVEDAVARGAGLMALQTPPAVPAGLPAELLTRRPDLRQAEQTLFASQARMREARAAIYPDLALTAHLGSESKALADLFTGPAAIWGLAAGAVQTVFNAGRTQAAVAARAAVQDQALASYEQAVRVAFRETLDALEAHREARESEEAEARRAEALARAAELAELRYQHGTASLLEVLDAQRQLHQAEDNRLDARRARLTASAGLIKALGGGW